MLILLLLCTFFMIHPPMVEHFQFNSHKTYCEHEEPYFCIDSFTISYTLWNHCVLQQKTSLKRQVQKSAWDLALNDDVDVHFLVLATGKNWWRWHHSLHLEKNQYRKEGPTLGCRLASETIFCLVSLLEPLWRQKSPTKNRGHGKNWGCCAAQMLAAPATFFVEGS